MCNNTTIVGLGNILMKDEGIGVWIARELKKRNISQNIDVIEGGTSFFDILLSLEKNVKKLVIVDALMGDGTPGAIHRLLPDDVNTASDIHLSVHQMGILEAFSITQKMGNPTPETVIIGIEPYEISWGLGVTSELKQKFPEIIDTVLKEVSNDCYRKETNK